MKIKRLAICLLAVLCMTLAACGSKNNEQAKIQSIEDVNGKPMGCMSGSIFDKLIEEQFPDSSITYYNSRSDLLLGLKSGKVDGYICDEPVAMMVLAQNDDVTYLSDAVGYVDYGICFSDPKKNVRDEFNVFLLKTEASGHLKELQDKWICQEGTTKKKVEYELTGENGLLMCATTPDAAPFSFMRNSVFQGYEVELLYEFAYEYGYDIQIDTLSFDALLTAVSTAKYDLALNGIYITPERAKSVNFCEPTYRGNDVVVIAKEKVKESKNIFETIGTSIYRNFIEEDRYQLLLQGLLTTVIISVLSVVLGTLLGFIVFILSLAYRGCKKVFDRIQKILGGLPIMVFLMLLFYVVFNKSALSGTVVSIIGFGIVFAATVYDLLKAGVSAVDSGQMEAALALGYGQWSALFRMVLPQAIQVVMTSYEREIVSLIKTTSVVGYVSVSDLTRMSDIIRGRTYDALLPLVVIAVAYFGVCALLVAIVDKVLNKIIIVGEE